MPTDKIQFPHTVEILMYPNVFIAETVSIVDSTGYMQGFNNNMKPAKGDSMTLPDGTKN